MQAPDKLRDLDLDAFAEELARQEYGNKRTTLYDIRNELSEPFKERRQAFSPLAQVWKTYLELAWLMGGIIGSRVVYKTREDVPQLLN